MIDVRQTEIDGVLEVRTPRHGDERGFFSEIWNRSQWIEAGIDHEWVQDNHSRSARGVLRGLHYQLEPAAQVKLVRVSRGSVFDVAVDVRGRSPTFGRHVARVLSADEWNQLLIPRGFAHGFLALEDGTEVQYKVSAAYAPGCEQAVQPFDPSIAVSWPLPAEECVLSERDRSAPLLRDAAVFP